MKRQNDSSKILNRDFNLDLIRLLALYFVASVHFFLHNGFYSHTVSTIPMNIMTAMRTLFLICVPLFMLLTGYLQSSKEIVPSKKYYLKLTKTIVPYLVIMTVDLLYYIIKENKHFTVKEAIENFTSFTHYSWYVEMYIGLFLLIPFLNIIWQKLNSRKQEHILIITLFVLTILPSFFNVYQFDAENWWIGSNKSYWELFPAWWTKLYPITYYYVGAYLCRHKSDMKMKPIFAFLIFLGCTATFVTYALIRFHGIAVSVYSWTDYNSVGVFSIAVSAFFFVNSINFKKVPMFLRRVVGKLSDLAFGAYLGTWVIDYLLYPHIKSMIPEMDDRLWAYLPTVLTVLTGAFIISAVADLFTQIVTLVIKLIDQKHTQNVNMGKCRKKKKSVR